MDVHLFAQESAKCLFGEQMTLEIHAVKMANVDAIVNIPQKTTNAIKEKLILDTNSLHTIDHQVTFKFRILVYKVLPSRSLLHIYRTKLYRNYLMKSYR